MTGSFRSLKPDYRGNDLVVIFVKIQRPIATDFQIEEIRIFGQDESMQFSQAFDKVVSTNYSTGSKLTQNDQKKNTFSRTSISIKILSQ